MATKTFCDLTGEEGPVTQVMIAGTEYEISDACKTDMDATLLAWRGEKLKTKKQTVVVTADVAESIAMGAPEVKP